jgi:hypothetical protein
VNSLYNWKERETQTLDNYLKVNIWLVGIERESFLKNL